MFKRSHSRDRYGVDAVGTTQFIKIIFQIKNGNGCRFLFFIRYSIPRR